MGLLTWFANPCSPMEQLLDDVFFGKSADGVINAKSRKFAEEEDDDDGVVERDCGAGNGDSFQGNSWLSQTMGAFYDLAEQPSGITQTRSGMDNTIITETKRERHSSRPEDDPVVLIRLDGPPTPNPTWPKKARSRARRQDSHSGEDEDEAETRDTRSHKSGRSKGTRRSCQRPERKRSRVRRQDSDEFDWQVYVG